MRRWPARRRLSEAADQLLPHGRSPPAAAPRCPGTGTGSACTPPLLLPALDRALPRRRPAGGGGGCQVSSTFLVSELLDTSKVWAEGGRSTSEVLLEVLVHGFKRLVLPALVTLATLAALVLSAGADSIGTPCRRSP